MTKKKKFCTPKVCAMPLKMENLMYTASLEKVSDGGAIPSGTPAAKGIGSSASPKFDF